MNKFNQEVKNRIDEYNKNTIEDFMLFWYYVIKQ